MKGFSRALLCLMFVVTLAGSNTFAQKNDFSLQENQVAAIYEKLVSFIHGNFDSLSYYSAKFEKEFTRLIQNNSGTLQYGFKKLVDSSYCWIKTSADGNFRIYSWDSWMGGTMHYFKVIYQWKSNGKIFTKLPNWTEGDAGFYCSNIFSVEANKRVLYLAITNSTVSTKDVIQSVSTYRIDNKKLVDTVKIFKTKSKKLNRIDVEYDFFSVVDRPERPVEVISYNDKLKALYIAVVDGDGKVTNRDIKYQLRGNYLEFVGIEVKK